ncbi:AAA family ATPase [Leptolyngbya ohadii]|uniref:AAA family ATPase n=1 Tax=Leptolyngbya ohadii TaxID=1962290 RepID=UPI000B59BCEF|nr:ATP-binding protein [Leptolyngbya ohadii]
MGGQATLHFFCGKMAAGKSTLAKELALREKAILFSEDELLSKLFPEEIHEISDYIKYSTRLKEALTDPICNLLSSGISVVLDFPGNTTRQRAWFRKLFEQANVQHKMHFIDATDDRCKQQLKQRSKDLPPDSPFTTDAEFDAITAYFQPPADDEGFHLIRYERK